MKNIGKPILKVSKKNHKKIYDVRSKNNRNIKETIEKRYNILIIVIIAVMTFLIGNLFVIQIIKHDFYVVKVNQLSQSIVTSNSAPRGRIYDRHGRIIVDNEAVKVIYYQKPNGVTTNGEIEVAYKLAAMVKLDYSSLTDTNLRDFWIKNNRDEANAKITDDEWKQLEERRITSNEIEQLKRDRITTLELAEYGAVDKLAAYIYNLMNIGYSYDEKTIKKEEVSDEEYALIAENISNLPGVDVRLDWKRIYPYGDVFRTLLGSVSTTETGIPYELKDYYLEQGYSLNDRVGTSYLEYQYESVLKGTKTKYQITDDGSYKVIEEGSRGNDIVLTIDIELQKAVEEILKDEILKAKKEPNTKYYNKSYVIISDPITGEIIAMSGMQIVETNDGEYKFYDYTPGIVTSPITPGSIIKGASHIVGYNNGAIEFGEVRQDNCIKIASTPLKCSWTTLSAQDDIGAIRWSSNVYQFLTAIKVGKGNYVYDKPLSIDESAFDIYRDTFSQFGLGVKTGIDLPVESLGYKGESRQAGHLLDFAIGQYDTYTPIQLVQYVNTIANNGYRTRPYLLKAIYKPTKDGLTDVISETTTTILNKVDTEDKYMERIQQGFIEVMKNGTGVGFVELKHQPAGKTGTSESFIDTDSDGIVDTETLSNTFVSYAPFDDPKVSFVVLSPDIYYNEGRGVYRTLVNKRISSRISQKYFEIYE